LVRAAMSLAKNLALVFDSAMAALCHLCDIVGDILRNLIPAEAAHAFESPW